MDEIKFKGGAMRMEAFQKLQVFLANPGKFCLIVLGGRGSGKHFAIESAFKKISKDAEKELCIEHLVFFEPNEIPKEAAELNNLFKNNEYKTIVIEDVEELSYGQQKLLFKALSTTDGTFGVGENYNLRVVFTSSKDIDELRTDKDLLLGLFWDRISQLVVEFPSFNKEGVKIVEDFRVTWKKMKFEKTKGYEHFAETPGNTRLKIFLENKADRFEGGFRDLDKIACLYFNYRIFHYGDGKKILEEIENKVIESVIDDFFSKSQMQDGSDNDDSIFRFEIGFSHKELLAKYKIQLRKWAVKKYQSVAKAEEILEFKPGSLKNYVKDKVTTQAKEKVLGQKKK